MKLILWLNQQVFIGSDISNIAVQLTVQPRTNITGKVGKKQNNFNEKKNAIIKNSLVSFILNAKNI